MKNVSSDIVKMEMNHRTIFDCAVQSPARHLLHELLLASTENLK